VGNKSKKRETIASNYGRNEYNLSFEKEYVKLAWEYTGKPGRENWDI
jgi:hypothetical protein